MAEVILRPIDTDSQWLIDHPDRKCHIRKPVSNKEMQGEYWSLGAHDSSRRRILIWRVPTGHPMKQKFPYLAIPFLAFADETIEDDDKVLLPLIEEIMQQARRNPPHG